MYNNFRRQNITEKYPEAISTIGETYRNLFITDPPNSLTFNASEFTKFTCETFELALLFDYLLLNFPNISDTSYDIPDRITNLLKEIVEINPQIQLAFNESTAAAAAISSGASKPPASINFTQLKDRINSSISEFNSIMAKISTLETTLNKYITNTAPLAVKVNISTTITNFQKTPNRKLASGWSWDNTQGNSRMWETFKDMVGLSSYKSDKNLFLYNLDLLPDILKQQLCEKYLIIKGRLEIDPPPSIVEKIGRAADPSPISNEARLLKFNIVTKGFISEVFLNFGFKIPEPRDGPPDPPPPAEPTAPYINDQYVLNPRYEVSITTSLCVVDAGPLSEDAILSENGEATIINISNQTYPENLLREKALVNYSTEISPISDSDSGRPIVDSLVVSNTRDELIKNKTEAEEIVSAAGIESSEAIQSASNSSRTGLEEDVAFKSERNRAILDAISGRGLEETQGASSSESPKPDIPLDIAVQSDIIKTSANDVSETIKEIRNYDEKIAAAPSEPSTESGIEIRKAIEPALLINNTGIEIKRGAKLLGADFEPNIKNATYVLLNALLGYKCTAEQMAIFQEQIYQISKSDYLNKTESDAIVDAPSFVDELGKFHDAEEIFYRRRDEDAAEGVSALPPPPPKPRRTIRAALDSLQKLPAPKGGMIGGDGSLQTMLEKSDILINFFTLLNLPQSASAGPFYEDANLLKEVNYLFHPLLPIYMLAESLNEISENDNIQESMDYDLYQKYLTFLERARDNVLSSYRSKEPLDVAHAYMLGTCLREFLFYADVHSMEVKNIVQLGGKQANQIQPHLAIPYTNRFINNGSIVDDGAMVDVGEGKSGKQKSDLEPELDSETELEPEPEPDMEFEIVQPPIPGYEEEKTTDLLITDLKTSYCENFLGMSNDEFLPVSLITGVLNYFISGIQIRSPEEKEIGEKMLNSDLFTNFIKNINVGNIFRENIEIPEPIHSFKRKCFTFLLETGNIIITERGGVALNIPSEESLNSSYPDLETRRKQQETAAESRRKIRYGFGGSKKLRSKKHKNTIKLLRKHKKKISKHHKRYDKKKYTKRN